MYLFECALRDAVDGNRFEFEDKKEYLNELSKQQFDMAATTHYTTSRSEVSWQSHSLSLLTLSSLYNAAGFLVSVGRQFSEKHCLIVCYHPDSSIISKVIS